MYIVKYQGGSYEDFYEKNVFVTNKKSTATKYVTRFNKLLKKWKNYYKQFETNNLGISWIADKHIDKHFNRWNQLGNISTAFWEEIEQR